MAEPQQSTQNEPTTSVVDELGSPATCDASQVASSGDPADLREHPVARWASVAITFLLGLAFALSVIAVFVPSWLTNEQSGPKIPARTTNNEVQVAQLELDVISEASQERRSGRDSGFKLAAGLAALAAGVLAWAKHEQSRNDGKRADREEKRKRAEDLRLAEAATNAKQQYELSERRADREQFNKRFADAVAMIGHESPEIQQGGLYALEELSLDSESHLRSITEVVCGFVRNRGARWLEDDTGESSPSFNPVAQTAITVLGRSAHLRASSFNVAPDKLRRVPFDLRNAYLCRADLSRGSFEGANLRGAELQGAILTESNFADADFQRCNLDGAQLSRISASDATFERAKMRTARLVSAVLVNANLNNADLTDAVAYGANLSGATLEETICVNASMQGALFYGAKVGGANFSDAVLTHRALLGVSWDRSTQWPDEFDPPTEEPTPGYDHEEPF